MRERGSLDVQQVATAEFDEWAAFVADSPTATGLHAPGWHAVLSEAFAVTPLFLRVRDDAGRVVGVLPLFRSRSVLFGDFISSLEDGHCAADVDVARALGRGALDLLAQEASGCLIYKTNFAADPCSAGGRRVETVKTVVSTDKSADALFAALNSNTRRKVRKAGREGHRVPRGERVAGGVLCNLFCLPAPVGHPRLRIRRLRGHAVPFGPPSVLLCVGAGRPIAWRHGVS